MSPKSFLWHSCWSKTLYSSDTKLLTWKNYKYLYTKKIINTLEHFVHLVRFAVLQICVSCCFWNELSCMIKLNHHSVVLMWSMNAGCDSQARFRTGTRSCRTATERMVWSCLRHPLQNVRCGTVLFLHIGFMWPRSWRLALLVMVPMVSHFFYLLRIIILLYYFLNIFVYHFWPVWVPGPL